MGQGGGREGELSKNLPENNDFAPKFKTFFTSQGKNEIFLENVKNLHFFWVKEGIN